MLYNRPVFISDKFDQLNFSVKYWHVLFQYNYDSLLLLIVASFGNVLGSVFNWALGLYSRNLITKKWFPFKGRQIESSSKWFDKFGKWSLLFAWVPIIGDPLTLAAGLFRVKFLEFLILVSIGKVSRYFLIYYFI